jgi:hypothetical protein
MRKSEDENREERGWCRERDGEQQREQKEVNSLAGEGRQNMARGSKEVSKGGKKWRRDSFTSPEGVRIGGDRGGQRERRDGDREGIGKLGKTTRREKV